MRHPIWLMSLLAVAGCRTSTPVVAPGPEAAPVVKQSPAPEAAVPIVVVEQQALTDVPAGFDPTGTIVLDGECRAWTEDGTYLGEAPEDRCIAWSDDEARISPDGRIVAKIAGSAVALEGPGTNASLACDGCKPIMGLGWSPQGDRLAVVREGTKTVELWSVEQRAKLDELPLAPGGKVVGVQVGWSTALYVLLTKADERPLCDELEEVDEDTDCLYDYMVDGFEDGLVEFSLARYPSLDGEPEIEPVRTGDSGAVYMGYDVVTRARLDPGGRCLYYEESDSEPRESIGSRITVLALAGACTLDHADTNDQWYWSLESAEWTQGPRTQLISVTSGTYEGAGDGGMEQNQYEIEVVELGEEHRKVWSTRVDSVELPEWKDGRWVEMSERELLWAGAHDEVDVVWKHCFTRHIEGEGVEDEPEEWCESTMKLPAGCEFLDRDPGHAFVLASCGASGELSLLSGRRRVGLSVPGDAQWVWGEGWLATVEPGTGVVLRSLAAPKQA
ncbi:MAG: hypothetical protein KDK70_38655, partial [Myxococcales bacterium]|nr:hypothetical protein [Myxococcales bacterium]